MFCIDPYLSNNSLLVSSSVLVFSTSFLIHHRISTGTSMFYHYARLFLVNCTSTGEIFRFCSMLLFNIKSHASVLIVKCINSRIFKADSTTRVHRYMTCFLNTSFMNKAHSKWSHGTWTFYSKTVNSQIWQMWHFFCQIWQKSESLIVIICL